MRILWLSWRDIKNPQAGGAEKVAIEIASRLAKEGNKVTIFTSKFKKAPEGERLRGVSIIRKGNHLTCRLYTFLYYLKHKDFDLIIDEINTIPFFSIFYAKNKSRVLIHQLAKEYWFRHLAFPLSFFGYILEPLWLKLYKNTPTIALSNSTKKDLSKLGFKNVTTYTPGIDFKPQFPLKKQDLILFIGRLTKAKRPKDAISAFKIINGVYPKIRFSIVGRGHTAYVNLLKKEIEKQKLKRAVKFEGFVSEKQKISLLKKAKIVLIPSVREGWCLVATEANALGCIPVAYNVPGLKDAIKNGQNGILVTNPRELAQAAIDILKNERKRTKIAKAGYQSSKNFSWDKCYQDFYQFVSKNQKSKITPKDGLFRWILAITFTGALIRLAFALILPLGGYDETYDIFVAQKPVSQMLRATLNFYPPLWHLILNFLEKFTTDYILLRILPVTLGTFSIFLAAHLAKKIFNCKIAILSALIFALSPAQIYYSASLRLYSLAIFISLLIFISFVNFLKNDSKKNRMSLVFASAIGNHTYYLFPILSFCFILYSLIQKKVRQTRLRTLLLCFVISGTLTLPLLFYRQTLESGSQNALPSVSITKILSIPITYSFPLSLAQLTNLYPYWDLNLTNLLLLLFSASSIVILLMFLKIKEKYLVLTIPLIFAPVITVIFSSAIASIFSLRGLIIFSIPFYILLAQIISKSQKFTFLYFCLAAVSVLAAFTFFTGKPIPPEKTFIQKNLKPGDLLIHTEFTTYIYFSYLFPQFEHRAAIDSLYVNSTNKNLLNYYPQDPQALISKEFWLLEIPSDIHKEKVHQFKQEIQETHKQISSTKFRDFEIYRYEP
ncbi:MAG: glycosyltransferase [Candidatus Curtissbacteria bacterium]|nr:glycosyltransferase [Candidatus Curtissbacteria bacterium]